MCYLKVTLCGIAIANSYAIFKPCQSVGLKKLNCIWNRDEDIKWGVGGHTEVGKKYVYLIQSTH